MGIFSAQLNYYNHLLRIVQGMLEKASGRVMPGVTIAWAVFMGKWFLDAPSHLYKRVCPYVRPSVRRSVGPSVPRYFQTRTRRILCRVSGLVI